MADVDVTSASVTVEKEITVTGDSVTTVTIEKTVTVTSADTNDDGHVYAEVVRHVNGESGALIAELKEHQEFKVNDDDYMNAGEVKKEITLTIEKSSEEKGGQLFDLGHEEGKEVNVTVTKDVLTVTKDDDDDVKLTKSEVTISVHKDDDDDDVIRSDGATLHALRDDSEYANQSELVQSGSVSVTITKTEITHEIDEGYLVPAELRAEGLGERRDEIRDEIREEIRDEIRDEIGDRLDGSRRSSLSSVGQHYENVREIREEIREEIRDEIRDNRDERDGLREEIRDETRDEIREEIRDSRDERYEIRDEIREEIRDEIRDNIREEIKEEIRDELRYEIGEVIRDEVRDGIRDEVVERTYNELEMNRSVEIKSLSVDVTERKVDISVEQKNDVKSPTGAKSPAASGLFVLRNARQKDAMHFMQHVRDMASHQNNEREKDAILTILRSTSRDDNVTNFTDRNSNRRSVVTNDLVKQFEAASAGSGGVFPTTPGVTSPMSPDHKHVTDRQISAHTHEVRSPTRDSAAISVTKTTTVTVTKNESNDTKSAQATTTVIKEVKSSEDLAKQLEQKLKVKEQQQQQHLQQQQQQKEVTVTITKTELTTNGVSATITNGEGVARPGTLLVEDEKPKAPQVIDTSGRVIRGPGIIPQWQLDLREKNRSKRATTGSVTSPTSPNQPHSTTSPQSPPWMTDLQRKNVKVSSISDEGQNKK